MPKPKTNPDPDAKSLVAVLQAACEHLTKTGGIRTAPSEVRDWWGKRRAEMRKEQDTP